MTVDVRSPGRAWRWHAVAGAIAALAVTTLSASAHATTVDFAFLSAGKPVATGAFTYADGQTGLVGFGDLSAFDLTVEGVAYDLGAEQGLANYRYFAYDTAQVRFVATPDACGNHGCGFQEILGALDDDFSSGFFFGPPGGAYSEYSTGGGGTYDTIVFHEAGSVPEPTTWALMLSGFALVGAVIRQRPLRRGKAS